MSEELKPCPFCGGCPVWNNGFCKMLVCADCNATGPNATTEAGLITAWNTREGDKE